MADVLETVNAAYEGLANETPEAPPPAADAPVTTSDAPPPETAEQKAERARDEAGRFAKEPKEKRPTLALKKPPAPDTPTAPGAPTPSPVVAAQPVAPEVQKIAAPQEWSGLAKVRWDKLPVAVQQEIVSHEQARAATVSDLAPVRELLDVNREFLVNQAGSLPAAMQRLMYFARMSVDNPPQLIRELAQATGVNLAALANGQQSAPGQQQPQDDIDARLARALDARLQPFMAQAEQQQTQQLESTINQFAADPKRPFFNDVRVHMGQLIQAGAAKSLEEAYEQATWANPTIRAHLLEEQREATEKANAAQVQKARQAQRASVTGSPLEGAQPAGGRSKGNVRDVVAQLYDDLSGA